jgi:hypothetical protein
MSSDDYATSRQDNGRCPQCGEGFLRAWYELTAEERAAAERLPASADFTPEERAARHRFCPWCWHEEVFDEPRTA